MLYWSQNGGAYTLKWRKNLTNIDLRVGARYIDMFWVSGLGVEGQQNLQRQIPILMISLFFRFLQF
jgi:hypothetical protein